MYNSLSQPSLPSDPPTGPLHRQASRSNSVSSSVVTVKRSASLKDQHPDSAKPYKKPTPPPSRRRSSVAHVAVESIGGIREGIGNLNRWSQSTTSSKSSVKEKDSRQGSFSRRLSISGSSSFTSLHGSSAHQSSPPRKSTTNPRRSPASSPHQRSRPHSPVYDPSRSVTALPPISTLPFLPATIYDPKSPDTSATDTPSTSGLYTPNIYTTAASTN